MTTVNTALLFALMSAFRRLPPERQPLALALVQDLLPFDRKED
jgi:hypothetical protein